MIGKLLSTAAMALGGGKYRIALNRYADEFVLQAYKGKSSVPLAKAAAKFEPLAAFVHLESQPDHTRVLPLALLQEAKSILHALARDGLDVMISPEADALQLVKTPEAFRHTYVWDSARGALVTQGANAATYVGQGWFVSGDHYWHVTGTLPEDDLWLRVNIMIGPAIIDFISRVSPGWRQRGLPYSCHAQFERSPALTITVTRVLSDAIELAIVWRVPHADIHDIPSLPGYVMTPTALMPGVSPQLLLRGLPAPTGCVRLSGQQIPLFLRDMWPSVRAFTDGQVDELLLAHPILSLEPELILEVNSRMRDGLGVTTAEPVVMINNRHSAAAELSRQLDAHTEFIRTADGWLPSSSVTKLGIGPLGRLDDGTPLEPSALSPTEVLNRGSQRLSGPWSRVEVPGLRVPQGNGAVEITGQHVDFLRRWCLPGGIVSTSPEVVRAFAASVAAVVKEAPEAKVLVVGTRDVLDSLDTVWSACHGLRLNGLKNDPAPPPVIRGLVIVSARALDTVPELLRTRWTLVCLMTADALVRSTSTKLFANLKACRASLVLGTFTATDFLNRTPARNAIAQLFRVGSSATLTHFTTYGLRDPIKPPPPLPSPYSLQAHRTRQVLPGYAVEFALPGPTPRPTPTGALAIPPRAAPTYARSQERIPDLGKSGLLIEWLHNPVTYATAATKFVTDARRFASTREQRAPLVPFMSYWPTYDAMTAAQRRWYFYWRGQVRDGNAIDTDLSYIFVHVYELVNRIGVASARDGYERLWLLWMGYRERFPKLDFYLADWLMDYVLVNRLDVSMMHSLAAALPATVGVSEPDLWLASLVGVSPLRLPIALIAALSDYRFRKSKFYLDGHQELLDTTFQQVVQHVNTHLLSTVDVGLFDLFKPRSPAKVRRDLFRSALYDGSGGTVVSLTLLPYSTHLPLRAFMTALVKHAENRLRASKGYEGKLRGFALDPAIQTVVDEFLGIDATVPGVPGTTRGANRAPVLSPPPRVVIDMEAVGILQRESDEIRSRLLDGVEQLEVEAQPPNAHSFIHAVPAGDIESRPDLLPTDLDPINAFVDALDDYERRLLQAFAEGDWLMTDAEVQQVLPGLLTAPVLDHVNELAIEWLGDLLITLEDDVWVVGDDLRDDLAGYLGGHRSEKLEQPPDRQSFTSLPAEWAAFASGLVSYQFETLRALLESSDLPQAIRNIADQHALMPALLIDSINEQALDALGDYIIVPGSDPPTIEDEDHDLVVELVACWLNSPERA